MRERQFLYIVTLVCLLLGTEKAAGINERGMDARDVSSSIVGGLLAQAPAPAGSPGAAPEAVVEAKVEVNLWQEIVNSTGAMITAASAFLVLLTGLIVTVTKLFGALNDLRKEREFFAGGILQSNPQALTEKREGIDYQIVLLGDGNTGKTTFLRMLSQNPKADLHAKTGEPQTFGFALTTYEPGNWESIRFLVDDYAGQNPGEIAASPSLIGVSSERPRAGAAVFMLDISRTVPGTGEVEPGTVFNNAGTFSPARLRSHVQKWGSDGLSNLQAHLRGRVRFNYVCWYINKIDLAAQWTVAEEKAIKQELRDLFAEVRGYPLFNTKCRFEVIFGTLAVNEKLDGPSRRDRLSVGCNLPVLWNRLVERARLAGGAGQT